MAEGNLFAQRRDAFFEAMSARDSKAVAVISSAPVAIRNNDVEHDYRQDSDFYYLSGFEEPESVLVLQANGRKVTMFVRPRDAEREVWDGARAGVDGAVSAFGASQAFAIGELASKLPGLMEHAERLYYRVGRDRSFDEKVFSALESIRRTKGTRDNCPHEIVDPGSILHEMRLRKSDGEIECMRRAASITKEAHIAAMRAAKPGMFEYELEAILLETFRKRGSPRVAYGSIVGSGPNATTLHYTANTRKMLDGELVLIDAGCEVGLYASDVTRTFPVNGRFSKEQRAIYEIVLAAQLAGIDAVRVGSTNEHIHRAAVEAVTSGLVRIGLLSGSVTELIEKEKYKPFFMHGTAHWLGLDVHDVGRYKSAGAARPLQPGMVTTVEPGVYIAENCTTVAPEWRGIGVRIEDDVLVTEHGPDVLTRGVPKTVDEVEVTCLAS